MKSPETASEKLETESKPESDSPSKPNSPSLTTDTGFVLVGVDSLVLGRPIKYPIYDRMGVLLLAEDAIITPKFHRILREREISKIRMHNEDVKNTSKQQVTKTVERSTKKRNRDAEITQQLNQSVGNGLQFVTNNGGAVYEAIVDHGTCSYNGEKLKELEKKNQDQCSQLSEMMGAVVDSKSLNGKFFQDSSYALLEGMCEDFDCVNSLASNLSFDDSLAKHCHRMSVLGMSIGVEMGLNDENVCRIGVTGMLHDWGMLKVPEHIRNPTQRLNEAERLELQKHVIYSVDLLEKINGLPTLVPLISYQIHEQINGQGYPRGRAGNKIHLFARILHVAHCYVELTTANAFREALTPYDATMQLFRYSKNGILDSVVLRALLRAQSLYPVGSMVMLSSGKVARVLRSNGDRFVEPIVQI